MSLKSSVHEAVVLVFAKNPQYFSQKWTVFEDCIKVLLFPYLLNEIAFGTCAKQCNTITRTIRYPRALPRLLDFTLVSHLFSA